MHPERMHQIRIQKERAFLGFIDAQDQFISIEKQLFLAQIVWRRETETNKSLKKRHTRKVERRYCTVYSRVHIRERERERSNIINVSTHEY